MYASLPRIASLIAGHYQVTDKPCLLYDVPLSSSSHKPVLITQIAKTRTHILSLASLLASYPQLRAPVFVETRLRHPSANQKRAYFHNSSTYKISHDDEPAEELTVDFTHYVINPDPLKALKMVLWILLSRLISLLSNFLFPSLWLMIAYSCSVCFKAT